jgi:hypothetical protein
MPTTVVHCQKDEYDVYIGRPSKWGNPFSYLDRTLALWKTASREEAIERYEKYLKERPELLTAVKTELRGKVLGCWCSPKSCHGDVLARIADED